MNETTLLFCEVIRKQLFQKNLDIVNVVRFSGDNSERQLALEQLLTEVQNSGPSNTPEYWVKLIPRKKSLKNLKSSEGSSQKPSLDGIYLPNGKLNVPYLMKNAEILFEAGDFLNARKIYRSVLQSGEYTGTVLCRLGRCFEAEGKLEEACAKFEESLVFHPSMETYKRLAALLVRMNRSQQAAEVMERAQIMLDQSVSPEAGHQTEPALPKFSSRTSPRKVRLPV